LRAAPHRHAAAARLPEGYLKSFKRLLRAGVESMHLHFSSVRCPTLPGDAERWFTALKVEVRRLRPTLGAANGLSGAWISASRAQWTFSAAGSNRATLADMSDAPEPADLTPLAARYGISPAVVEDLYARRRAGAHDAELVNLLSQQDRGGLDRERARALVDELPLR
jgi:hypothetical protein